MAFSPVASTQALGVLLLLIALSGCGNTHRTSAPTTSAPPAPPTTAAPTTAAPTTPPTTAVPPTTAAPSTTTTTAPAAAAFTATVSKVTRNQVPYTWHPGCPVSYTDLRLVHLTYYGFDHQAHTGSIVVNGAVVTDVTKVFRTLYDDRFEIKEMVPEDAYHGNDNAAAAADDTSGFNCRDAVTSGPPVWSVHAYGEAIDVNDVQNPYIEGSTVIPPAGQAYFDRSDARAGMAVPGGTLVDAFASVGWQWGGRWSGSPDYQHFSLTGG